MKYIQKCIACFSVLHKLRRISDIMPHWRYNFTQRTRTKEYINIKIFYFYQNYFIVSLMLESSRIKFKIDDGNTKL